MPTRNGRTVTPPRAERSVTGDDRTDALVTPAMQLAAAVHEFDHDRISAVLAKVTDQQGLLITLAAMVPDDRRPTDLLGWLRQPGEYDRLRAEGVDCLTANDLVAGLPLS